MNKFGQFLKRNERTFVIKAFNDCFNFNSSFLIAGGVEIGKRTVEAAKYY